MPTNTDDTNAPGPICPNCRQPLRENLRQEEITAQLPSERGHITITYCGSCGWTLDVSQVRFAFRSPEHGATLEVAVPENEQMLEGQFQLRCRELIAEIRAAGFNPGGWIGLINSLGAVGAAKKLISDHRILPVTHWLVDRKRPELTMEYEIGQAKWADLFTNGERAEAADRLKAAGGKGENP